VLLSLLRDINILLEEIQDLLYAKHSCSCRPANFNQPKSNTHPIVFASQH
jgi:hypothetical protein